MSLLLLLPFPSTLPRVRRPPGQQQVLVLGVKGRSAQPCLSSEGSEFLFSAWLASWGERKRTYIPSPDGFSLMFHQLRAGEGSLALRWKSLKAVAVRRSTPPLGALSSALPPLRTATSGESLLSFFRRAEGQTSPLGPGSHPFPDKEDHRRAFWQRFPSCPQAGCCQRPPRLSAGSGQRGCARRGWGRWAGRSRPLSPPAPRGQRGHLRARLTHLALPGTGCTNPECTASASGCGTSPRSSGGFRSRPRSFSV